MKVGVIGSGAVGKVLAAGFKKHGHDVMIGSRDAGKLAVWAAEAGVASGSFEATAEFGEIVVLSVGGAVAGDALTLIGADRLAGKVVIDTTNPIGGGPPEKAVLHYFTGMNDSLMERLQAQVPGARFVKAFSCVGNAYMVNPAFPGGPPTMFIAGNDAEARATVAGVLDQFGWEVEDLGSAAAARAIEPLCMLWCIPGLSHGRWNHAFKLLRT